MMFRKLLLMVVAVLPACADRTTADGDESTGSTGGSTDGASDGDESTSAVPGTTDGTTDEGPASTGPDNDTTDGGSTGGDTTTGGADSTDTGAALHSVSGTLTRSVEPSPQNDAVGDVYLAIVDNCGLSFDVITAGVAEDVDLSAPGASAEYTVPGVPNGEWFVVAFLDDNDDAADNMMPGPGDLGVSSGVSIGCAPITIAGADATGIDIDFNFVF